MFNKKNTPIKIKKETDEKIILIIFSSLFSILSKKGKNLIDFLKSFFIVNFATTQNIIDIKKLIKIFSIRKF
ncbi:MAG: hypothetical protein WC002_08955 [Candidatus Muiribacteriota bacterium]